MFEVKYSNHIKLLLKNKKLTRIEMNHLGVFISNFQENGLDNWNCYEGKIVKSSSNLPIGSDEYIYAEEHYLWHYHIGYPHYIQKNNYKTSDYVVHFMWSKELSHEGLAEFRKPAELTAT
jgi:hypothetical protein